MLAGGWETVIVGMGIKGGEWCWWRSECRASAVFQVFTGEAYVSRPLPRELDLEPLVQQESVAAILCVQVIGRLSHLTRHCCLMMPQLFSSQEKKKNLGNVTGVQ